MQINSRRHLKEKGQVLILGGVFVTMILISSYMVLNIGRVTSDKVELQNTADAAAFAAAEVQANAVSTIGWLNQAMGAVYFYMANHAANVTVESTKMAFVQHAYNGDNNNTFKQYDNTKKRQRNYINMDSSALGSEAAISALYDEAYLKAYEWLPRGEIWLWQMAKVQRGIAYITPVMAEKEVYLAIQGRAERAAIFPKYRMYVDPANNFDLEIHKIYDDGVKTGWDMYGHPGGLYIFAERDEQDFGPYDQDPAIDDEKIWRLILRYKLNPTDPDNELIVESLGLEPPSYETTVYRMKGTFPGWENWRTIRHNPDGTTIITGNGDTVAITQNPDGSTTIQGGSTNITYRRNGNTFDVLNNGTGQWESMGEVNTQVNGVDVRVTTNFNVSLGDVTVIDPNYYRIGNTEIHVRQKDIDISTHIGRAHISTEKGAAIVNGLSTANADGKWRRRHHGSHWSDSLHNQGGDTVRHRMLVTNPDSDWLYEIREIGSYMQEENDQAHHGDGRFAITNGADIALSRMGMSKNDLPWLAYPSEQKSDVGDGTGYSDKWYDLSQVHSGKPLSWKNPNDDRTIESFHITIPCWNSLCQSSGNKGCYPVNYELRDSGGVIKRDSNLNPVTFVEMEMCRICYYNHSTFNKEKRLVDFGGANSDMPTPFEKNGRLVVWTNNNFDYTIVNGDIWRRKDQLGTKDVPASSNPQEEPLLINAVRDTADYIPKYMLDAFSGVAPTSYGQIQSANPDLPWDLDHDGNGSCDVIMYPTDAREMNRNVASWYYYNDMSGMNAQDYLKSLQLLSLSAPKPMVLSEDFFKFGISVAVTNDKYQGGDDPKMLGIKDNPQVANSSNYKKINKADWGMIAIASARSAFWYQVGNEGGYIFSPGDIDWAQDPEYGPQYQSFKDNTNNGLDGSVHFAYDDSINFQAPTEYRVRRQFFVKRHRMNLYTSNWVAKLVPIKFAVRRPDLDLEDTDDYDSSARYLYYNLMRTEWRESYTHTSGWKPPEAMTLGPDGPRLSTSNEDIEALFTH